MTSCTKEKNLPKNFDYGTVRNSTYVNDYFDLKIPFPSDWTVVEGEQLKRIQEAGNEIAAGDNKHIKKVLEASEINTAQLLSLFRNKVGTKVDFNHNLQVLVENLNTLPSITTGKDYLFNARQLLLNTAMDIEIIEETQTLNIEGRNIDGLVLINTIKGLQIHQTYLAVVKNGFCLNFVLSYINDGQRDELHSIIGKMEL